MTTPPADGQDVTAAPPVACALDAADMTAQAGRWARLCARAMLDRARTTDGLRLRFRRGPGVEDELRALVAVESRCCSWAAWRIQAKAGEISLDISSAADGIAALHSMFTSPQPVPGRGGDRC